MCSLLPNPAPTLSSDVSPTSCTLLQFSLHFLLSQGWGESPHSSCWGRLGPEITASGLGTVNLVSRPPSWWPCVQAPSLATLWRGKQRQYLSLALVDLICVSPLPNTTVEQTSFSLSGRLKAQRGGETYLREQSNPEAQLPTYCTGKFLQIIQK